METPNKQVKVDNKKQPRTCPSCNEHNGENGLVKIRSLGDYKFACQCSDKVWKENSRYQREEYQKKMPFASNKECRNIRFVKRNGPTHKIKKPPTYHPIQIATCIPVNNVELKNNMMYAILTTQLRVMHNLLGEYNTSKMCLCGTD